jgi:hypothetical protein
MFKRNSLLMEEKNEGNDGGGGAGGEGAGAGAGGAGAGASGAAGGAAGAAGKGGDAGAGAGAGAGAAGAADDGKGKATWPDDWRAQMAGGDEKVAKNLERFASPKDVTNAWRSFQQRLSSGELKSALPKDAKPEDVAKWRTENGIPEKPEGYKMPEGLVIGDADKPLIDLFLKDMHGKNAPTEVVQTAVQSYYKIVEQQAAQIAENDVAHKTEMEDTLRAEWGGEYRGNVNAIGAMLESAPGGIKDKILSARTADGRAIMNDPDVLRWFATTARELNPVATVVPAGGDQMGAITDEIGKIEKLMGNRQSEYWKGPTADKMQARYRELITARDRKK